MDRNEILRSYGTDYTEMTKGLLEEADIAAEIHALAAAKQASGKAGLFRIGIKPNLVCPSPADFGGTTHPEIIAGIIEYLLDSGFEKEQIEILEGSWVGDRTAEAFGYCGYNALGDKYGIRLTDMQLEKDVQSCDCSGMQLKICTHALNTDYLINVPVLKGHCQTRITCALKNMKGLIPNTEKRRFHSLGLHEPIAHLNTVLKPELIVVDHICGDPDFEEGGNPVVRNCVMLTKDPVLTDAFAAAVLGVDVNEVRYVKLAEELKLGSTKLDRARLRTISGSVTEGEPEDVFFASGSEEWDACRIGTRRVIRADYAVNEVDSCSACYGVLLPALDRLDSEGLLDKLMEKLGGEKLCIGQGFRGKSGAFGIGNCTAGLDFSVKGCPPDEDEIYRQLKGLL